jgi:hypothetical protein
VSDLARETSLRYPSVLARRESDEAGA